MLYAWIPYLRYVGLNGSLTNGKATDKSDIDLMVVAAGGHIFTVRFFIISVLWFYNLKRNRRNIAGRLCVNYFITDDNLDIKPHTKRVAGFFSNMIALVDSLTCNSRAKHADRGENGSMTVTAVIPTELTRVEGSLSRIRDSRLRGNDTITMRELIILNNKWILEYKIPISAAQEKINQSVKPLVRPYQDVRTCVEFLLLPISDALEILLKKIQLWKIARHPLTASNSDKIIVSDKELMFHPRKSP